MKRVFLVAAAALLGATAAEAATTTAPGAAGEAPGAWRCAYAEFWPKPGHAWLDQPAAAELWRSSRAARFTDL